MHYSRRSVIKQFLFHYLSDKLQKITLRLFAILVHTTFSLIVQKLELNLIQTQTNFCFVKYIYAQLTFQQWSKKRDLMLISWISFAKHLIGQVDILTNLFNDFLQFSFLWIFCAAILRHFLTILLNIVNQYIFLTLCFIHCW